MTDKSVREMAEAERTAIKLRRQESKKAARVCEICIDELVEDIACLKTCGCEFHLECLRPYFAVQLDKGKTDITCPKRSQPNCTKKCSLPLLHMDMNFICDQNMYERWEQMGIN